MVRIFLLALFWLQHRVSLFRRPQNRVTDDSRSPGGGEEQSDFSSTFHTIDVLHSAEWAFNRPELELNIKEEEQRAHHEEAPCMLHVQNWPLLISEKGLDVLVQRWCNPVKTPQSHVFLADLCIWCFTALNWFLCVKMHTVVQHCCLKSKLVDGPHRLNLQAALLN